MIENAINLQPNNNDFKDKYNQLNNNNNNNMIVKNVFKSIDNNNKGSYFFIIRWLHEFESKKKFFPLKGEVEISLFFGLLYCALMFAFFAFFQLIFLIQTV